MPVSTDALRMGAAPAFRVLLNGSEDITSLAAYDTATGRVSLPWAYTGHGITVEWYCPASEIIDLPVRVTKSIYLNGAFVEATETLTLASNTNTVSIPLDYAGNIVVAQNGVALDSSLYSLADGVLTVSAPALGGDISVAAYAPRRMTRGTGGQVAHTQDPNKIYYGTFFTTYFTANGNTAFCLNPLLYGPASGTYDISRYLTPGADDLLIKCAYYLYGGPGYDAVKHALFEDPDSMMAYALSHAAASFAYLGDANTAFHGLGADIRAHLMAVLSSVGAQAMPPDGFVAFVYNEGGGVTQPILGWEYEPMGNLEILKVSANTDMSDGNPCYSLEGAVFDVYDAGGAKIGTVTTDAAGRARLEGITPGTGFYLVEVTPPKGFAENNQRIYFDIASGQTTTVRVSNRPQNDPVGILLQKLDAETSTAIPQGDGSLAGAQFTLKFYKGYYTNASQLANATPARTWVLRTDVNGAAFLHPDYLVSGDAFYYAGNNAPTLPLGTVSVQETKPPEGYLINPELFIRQITPEGRAESVRTYNRPLVPDSVIRGGVLVEKWDHEIGRHEAQGGATLEGAVFEIVNRSAHRVLVEGKLYAPGEVVYTMVTDATGTARTPVDLLPYGTFECREVSPPTGYLATGELRRVFTIREHGTIVELNTANTAIRNNLIRGDLRGVKIADGTAKRLAGVPFKITSLTTGESHVVVTDRNGEFSTASGWNPHSQNTNRGETDRDGVWFGEIETLNDGLGALLYDDYRIEELPCAANVGMELLSFEISVYRHMAVIDLGTLTDDYLPVPEIFTTAMEKESAESSAYVSESTTIVDTVYYSGLKPGREYTLEGILMDKATGALLLIEGEPVTATKTFTAPASVGTVTMEFTFDSRALAGHAVVVFESLLFEGKEIAAHADITDEGQTVTFLEPEIGTTAKGSGGGKTVPPNAKVTITDTVSYTGLLPGKAYTLKGVLMDKSTGKPLLVDGSTVAAEVTFTAKESSGSVDVVFTFDASALAGKTLVVFESLEYEGKEIAAHADIDDEGQTVTVENPPTETPKTPPTPAKPPQTGRDGLPLWLPIAVAVLAAGALGTALYARKKKKDEDSEQA